MPYISQECMKDFIDSIKGDGRHFSESNIDTLKSAMKYYFGYKVK